MLLEVYLHTAAFGELNHSPRPRDLWFEILPHHQFSLTIMTLKSRFSLFFFEIHIGTMDWRSTIACVGVHVDCKFIWGAVGFWMLFELLN